MSVAIDRAQLEVVIGQVDRLLVSDGGGLEFLTLSDDGILSVRMTGLCASCPSRPLSIANTVRPMLLDVVGVTAVEVVGARVSAEAESNRIALLHRAAEVARRTAEPAAVA